MLSDQAWRCSGVNCSKITDTNFALRFRIHQRIRAEGVGLARYGVESFLDLLEGNIPIGVSVSKAGALELSLEWLSSESLSTSVRQRSHFKNRRGPA